MRPRPFPTLHAHLPITVYLCIRSLSPSSSSLTPSSRILIFPLYRPFQPTEPASSFLLPSLSPYLPMWLSLYALCLPLFLIYPLPVCSLLASLLPSFPPYNDPFLIPSLLPPFIPLPPFPRPQSFLLLYTPTLAVYTLMMLQVLYYARRVPAGVRRSIT